MEDPQNNWEHINDLFSNSGKSLNILEEEIDIEIQKKYFDLSSRLLNNEEIYNNLAEVYTENVNDLLDENVADTIKIEMLVILSTVNDISVYRVIEEVYKTNTDLKKWAVIALQQSRILIQSSLLDEPGLYISTGLGGHGKLLRYFCVFFNNTKEKLQPFEQNIVQTETEEALKKIDGSAEKFTFLKGYNTLLLLLPLDADLNTFFDNLIRECNTFGNFLHKNMIITNVKKLTRKEISRMLKSGEPE